MEFVNTTMAQPVAVAATNLPSFFENHVPVTDFFSEITTNVNFICDDIFIYSSTNSFDANSHGNAFSYIDNANNVRCILQRSGRVSNSVATRLAQSNYYHRLRQLVTDIEQSGAITNMGIERRLFNAILRAHYTFPVLDMEPTIGALAYTVTNGMAIPPDSIAPDSGELIRTLATNEAFRVLGIDVPYYEPIRGGTGHVDLVVSTMHPARSSVFFLNCSRYGEQNTTAVEAYREGYLGEALTEGIMEACWRKRLRAPYSITLISSKQGEQLHAYGGTIRGSGLFFVRGTPSEIVKQLANWPYSSR